jgi:hypothetical protein
MGAGSSCRQQFMQSFVVIAIIRNVQRAIYCLILEKADNLGHIEEIAACIRRFDQSCGDLVDTPLFLNQP